ncbi:MAG: UDP binding domain-containing protein, partial [Solirubrobacterales bacterium]
TDERLVVATSAEVAAAGAHGLAVLTEWDEFKTLDFPKIFAGMHKPAFVFDGRNILLRAELEAIGFRVFAIGKPAAG